MGQKFLRDFVNRLLFSDTLQANFFVIDYKNTSLGIFSITKKQKKEDNRIKKEINCPRKKQCPWFNRIDFVAIFELSLANIQAAYDCPSHIDFEMSTLFL